MSLALTKQLNKMISLRTLISSLTALRLVLKTLKDSLTAAPLTLGTSSSPWKTQKGNCNASEKKMPRFLMKMQPYEEIMRELAKKITILEKRLISKKVAMLMSPFKSVTLNSA